MRSVCTAESTKIALGDLWIYRFDPSDHVRQQGQATGVVFFFGGRLKAIVTAVRKRRNIPGAELVTFVKRLPRSKRQESRGRLRPLTEVLRFAG